MFGDNPFETRNLDQLQEQYRAQLDTLSKMKAAQTSVLDEIGKELGTLNKEEQQMLYDSNEYKMSKNIYEANFLQFISNKFSQEYVNTPSGKEAALGLLKTIKDSKEKIAYQTKVKNEKINKVLELLDKDPEMRKRYDELTGAKKTKK